MIEYKGDIWKFPSPDVIVITTNGIVKSDGKLVMGAGIALQAKNKFPEIAGILGTYVTNRGNNVYSISMKSIYPNITHPRYLISFPTKHHYRLISSIRLIRKSCRQLVETIGYLETTLEHPLTTIILPRPGCGNGGLNWEEDIKPILQEDLKDNKFIVVNRD